MPATIVFSHANGFPAGTYRVLFDAWRDAGWQVAAVDKFGHDPRYPVSSNWPKLRDQLIDFIDDEVGGPTWHMDWCCWTRRSSWAGRPMRCRCSN